MHKRSLQPVDVLLNSLFRNLGILDRIRLESLRRKWHSTFPGSLSIHTAPTELKENRLVISVDSPAWLQHIRFLQKEIVEKIAAHGITQVQFRLGRVRIDEKRKVGEKLAPPEAFRELTGEDVSRISQVVEDIDDAGLRDQIRQTMEKAARRKRRQ
ncbi:MAG TPA: DUF721 domain-containing protein [Dissulfurispiraceae bacterium]|nr:DUF721 domain-containing protein [Dissulfurispiraceae bacterium]